jgi:hypothetical protein
MLNEIGYSKFQEELTLSEARTLSGVLFHFTDKHTAVSKNSLITLLTSAEEGFSHVLKSDSFFIYREEESEEPEYGTFTLFKRNILNKWTYVFSPHKTI